MIIKLKALNAEQKKKKEKKKKILLKFSLNMLFLHDFESQNGGLVDIKKNLI